MRRNLSPSRWRFLTDFISRAQSVGELAADAVKIAEWVKPAPRREKKLITIDREAENAAAVWARAENTANVRRIVMARARGRCEACQLISAALSMDHWLGGSGRRHEEEREETCWALCPRCNNERTHNLPSAAHWNDQFRMHCDRYKYTFVGHVEKQQPRFVSTRSR